MVRRGASTRIKISATVDPEVLSAVDNYIAETPGLDRSKVIDQALWLWLAEQQDQAMAAQFAATPSEIEQEERAAWRQIRRQAAERIFRSRS